jgi:hypothetical protein
METVHDVCPENPGLEYQVCGIRRRAIVATSAGGTDTLIPS